MQWYALYVNARHEKKIADKMREKDIECYLPVVKKMNQWSDRKKLVEKPLLPGYIFVRTTESKLDQPRFISGVVNYVRSNGKPAVIRGEEIEGLKCFVENGYRIEECDDEDLLPGDKVGFRLSDFRDYAAVIESLVGDHYAIVTFEGMGKNFKLKTALRSLKKKRVAEKQFSNFDKVNQQKYQ